MFTATVSGGLYKKKNIYIYIYIYIYFNVELMFRPTRFGMPTWLLSYVCL